VTRPRGRRLTGGCRCRRNLFIGMLHVTVALVGVACLPLAHSPDGLVLVGAAVLFVVAAFGQGTHEVRHRPRLQP